MRRPRGSVVLPVALVVLVIATVLSAGLAEVTRTELVIGRHRRVAAAALAAADACLARVVSVLPAGWDFRPALAGADGVLGTADDGAVPAPAGCTANLRPGPLDAARPTLDVAASAAGGARALRATMGRAAGIGAQSLVWITDPTRLGSVTGTLALDANDPARPDAPALAGIAGPADASVIDAWLVAVPGVSSAAGTGAPLYAPAPPFAELEARMVALGAAPIFVSSPPPAPATVTLASGDLVLDVGGAGAGVLVVQGRLDIRANFSFSGVVVAGGGLVVASGARFDLAGTLWLGAAAGAPALDVAGTVTVRHDVAALGAAEALVPLPRRARAVGMQDI
ncbi:MAG TPA: hypothetical protein VMS22_22000 [Candidatus Eisenbacteria bacterium]|nr:hypothetical protein [Candidatus Eisenbacteria bacterium]